MSYKVEIGETLYSLNVGNAARNREQTLTPVIVTKVGRKYFSAASEEYQDRGFMHTQYHLDDWSEKTEYTANSVLYRTPKDWEREKEMNCLRVKLRKHFEYAGNSKELTLEQLRTIALIIWPE